MRTQSNPPEPTPKSSFSRSPAPAETKGTARRCSVSVLMPVRNEGPYIDISLGAVLRQSWGLENMEILVLDGMSDDDTRQRVAAWQERFPHADLRVLDNPGRIAPCAMNVGLRAATGDVIVRVDGHCEIGVHYVAHAVAHLKHGADGVGGPLTTVGEGLTAVAIAAAMSSRFGVGGSAFRTTESDGDAAPDLDLQAVREVDTVAFPAYSRTIFERVGFYDEELVRNQDDEYNYRLRKLGGRLVLALDMPAKYYSRTGYKKLWRQYFQYGLWKVRVLQKHPRQMSLRQFVPAAFVGTLVAGALGSLISPWLGAAGLGALAAYLVVNLTASVLVARQAAGPDLPMGAVASRLPLAFLLLHFGYGTGFWLGLGRFAGRWGDHTAQESGTSSKA